MLFFHNINTSGNRICVSNLKTFLGAWITTRRVQSCVKPCIFCGAASGDQLQHLIYCDKLWYTVSLTFSLFLASFDPLVLLGLSPVSQNQSCVVHVAYHTYHALRMHDVCSTSQVLDMAIAYRRGCHIARKLYRAHYRAQHQNPCSLASPSPATDSGSALRTDLGPRAQNMDPEISKSFFLFGTIFGQGPENGP